MSDNRSNGHSQDYRLEQIGELISLSYSNPTESESYLTKARKLASAVAQDRLVSYGFTIDQVVREMADKRADSDDSHDLGPGDIKNLEAKIRKRNSNND